MAWTGCRDRDGDTHGPLCSVPVPREQRLAPFWESRAYVRLCALVHACEHLCALVCTGPASTACVCMPDSVSSPGEGTRTHGWAHPSARWCLGPPAPCPAGETEAHRVRPSPAAASKAPAVPRREAPAAARASSHVFGGALSRAAYTTAFLRVPAAPPSQPKASGGRAGGERGARSPPRSSRFVARWGFGGDGGVSHPGVAVPGWHRCPAAPCHTHPPPPPPSWAGKRAAARRGHSGTAAGDDACPRCQGRAVPAGAGGTVAALAAGIGLGRRSLRAWRDIDGAGGGELRVPEDACACVCMYVCTRVREHPPVLVPACPAGLGRRHPPGFAAISASSLDLILPCLRLACN